MFVESVPPTRRFRLSSRSWLTVEVALLLIQAALSVTVRQSVIAYTLIIFVVFVLGTGIATLNAVKSSAAIRLFYSFLAMALAMWALNQGGDIPVVSRST